MVALFDENDAPTDCAAYKGCRDSQRLPSTRKLLERVWPAYEPFADTNFVDQFRRHFHERAWELRLGTFLLRHGTAVTPRRQAGPDLGFEQGSQQIWIEAIAPNAGSGANEVPNLDRGPVPNQQIMLRYTSALKEKLTKFREYRKASLLTSSDVCVVAITGAQMPLASLGQRVPLIVRVCYGIGEEYVVVEVERGEVLPGGFHPQPHLLNANGSKVPSVVLSEENKDLSAVMFSAGDLANSSDRDEEWGSDYIVIHNPFATNPLPRGSLKVGREYWAAEDGRVQLLDTRASFESNA